MMEWWLILLIFFGALVLVMMSGLPVPLCFMVINLIGMAVVLGGEAGVMLFTRTLYTSLTSFTLLPLLLFVLMGNVMFYSGMGDNLITAVDKLLGRMPGRLGVVAVATGTLFATLTGSSAGSTALLGATLTPEMERRGYKKPMSLGPIIGAAGLAIMIPPSSLAILLGAIGDISIAGILIAIIVPGLLMAVLYGAYIIGRCWLQPSIAPAYEVSHIQLKEKVVDFCKYILPIAVVIFGVVGVILLGIGTPSEAAATGTLAIFILAAVNRKLNWQMLKKSGLSTMEIGVMILMILAGGRAFAQILTFSGAGTGMTAFVLGLPTSPIVILIAMQILILIIGMFMSPVPMIIFTLPLMTPIVRALGYSTIWYAVIFLLNLEMSTTSPPYGTGLFVMKGVAPRGTTMGQIYRAGIPFLICDAIVMALLFAWPQIALWLPGLMG